MPKLEITPAHRGKPLTGFLSLRVSHQTALNVKVQALVNGTTPGTLVRHWLLKGAAADGVDLEQML